MLNINNFPCSVTHTGHKHVWDYRAALFEVKKCSTQIVHNTDKKGEREKRCPHKREQYKITQRGQRHSLFEMLSRSHRHLSTSKKTSLENSDFQYLDPPAEQSHGILSFLRDSITILFEHVTLAVAEPNPHSVGIHDLLQICLLTNSELLNHFFSKRCKIGMTEPKKNKNRYTKPVSIQLIALHGYGTLQFRLLWEISRPMCLQKSHSAPFGNRSRCLGGAHFKLRLFHICQILANWTTWRKKMSLNAIAVINSQTPKEQEVSIHRTIGHLRKASTFQSWCLKVVVLRCRPHWVQSHDPRPVQNVPVPFVPETGWPNSTDWGSRSRYA